MGTVLGFSGLLSRWTRDAYKATHRAWLLNMLSHDWDSLPEVFVSEGNGVGGNRIGPGAGPVKHALAAWLTVPGNASSKLMDPICYFAP